MALFEDKDSGDDMVSLAIESAQTAVQLDSSLRDTQTNLMKEDAFR